MWLLVAAPTVSRFLPDWVAPDMGAWCTGHGLSDEHPSTPDHPALHTDACGYCALLANTPLLTGGTIAMPAGIDLPTSAPADTVPVRWHALPLLSAHPRGPPSVAIG